MLASFHRLALSRAFIQNCKRLLATVEEMTILYMELFKRDADIWRPSEQRKNL